ncbi:MAG: HD domain-containing protein [Lachnospiraceae bacterium]|nr:HD domain-containing protein [Lachnospiraceae bacterium]
MHYLTMKHLRPDMVLAKSIIGDNGIVLLNCGKKLSEATLKRMETMGFQGAYVSTQIYSDIIVDDIITEQLRLKAFQALQNNDVNSILTVASNIVKELKYKDVLKLDLLDIKSDNNYLFKHSISVAVFSAVLGIASGLNEEQLTNLTVAGLLHDIGQLEINENVRLSKSRFNTDDMEEMKKHPLIAYEKLKDYPGVSSVSKNAILFHHENLDGSGYYGETADKLGLFPKILRIADVYDSMTALKKYRDAMSPADAIEYIMSNTGTLFEKSLVILFLKTFPLYPVGFTVLLSDENMAVVVNNKSNPMRPVIRLTDGTNIDLSTDPAYRSIVIKEIV